MMRFVIFGPPGSGKGTYASRLAPQLAVVHIATGDIFRQMAKGDTPLSQEVREYLQKGKLVPDEVTLAIIKEELNKDQAQKGFFLDGFPRTVTQAQALEKLTQIDAVLLLIVPKEILIEKALARRICRNCGNIYNVADISRSIGGVDYILPPMAPREEGVCDKCGGKLYQREDDNELVIKDRLQVYDNQSKPVIEYYKQKGLPFVEIFVNRPPEEMVGQVMRQLQDLGLVA